MLLYLVIPSFMSKNDKKENLFQSYGNSSVYVSFANWLLNAEYNWM